MGRKLTGTNLTHSHAAKETFTCPFMIYNDCCSTPIANGLKCVPWPPGPVIPQSLIIVSFNTRELSSAVSLNPARGITPNTRVRTSKGVHMNFMNTVATKAGEPGRAMSQLQWTDRRERKPSDIAKVKYRCASGLTLCHFSWHNKKKIEN